MHRRGYRQSLIMVDGKELTEEKQMYQRRDFRITSESKISTAYENLYATSLVVLGKKCDLLYGKKQKNGFLLACIIMFEGGGGCFAERKKNSEWMEYLVLQHQSSCFCTSAEERLWMNRIKRKQ